MFKIPPVQDSHKYYDSILLDMETFAQKSKQDIEKRWEKMLQSKKKEQDTVLLDKRKDLELEKIRYINKRVNSDLRKIQKTFPKTFKLSQLYQELLDTSSTSTTKVKQALSTINSIIQRTDELTMLTERKIKYAKTHQTVGFLMKKHLGKVNSLFSKNKDAFTTLQNSRLFLNKLPDFKDLFTTSIAGFPNVGKSTLMKSITGSDVEIQNYPFTTKGLMFGYITHNEERLVQLIDTPGLLGRKKNNSIEQRAELILRRYSDTVVFVLDITESCGYPLEAQIKLLKSITESVPLIYLSKTDLYTEEEEEALEEVMKKIKKYKIYKNADELKQVLLDIRLKSSKKFDPSSVKMIK